MKRLQQEGRIGIFYQHPLLGTLILTTIIEVSSLKSGRPVGRSSSTPSEHKIWEQIDAFTGKRAVSLHLLHTLLKQQSSMPREMPSEHDLSSGGKWRTGNVWLPQAYRTLPKMPTFLCPIQNTDVCGMAEELEEAGRTITRALNFSKGHGLTSHCADSSRKPRRSSLGHLACRSCPNGHHLPKLYHSPKTRSLQSD